MRRPHGSDLPVLPPSVRVVEHESGFPRVDVSTRGATAQIYLHGAHLAAWEPADADAPVLWMSSRSFFRADKAIRGGVPICFPWFGPHATDKDAPMHGFARLADWTLAEAVEEPDGRVSLAFALERGEPMSSWPHPFRLTYRLAIGAQLEMSLEVLNTGGEPITFEEALHTYLSVGDIEAVTVTGLQGTEYLDKVAGFERRTQRDGQIRFTGETDRVYLDTTAPCVVRDPAIRRLITVSKSGSTSTVIWNPWIAKAHSMPDFGDDEWRRMLCVETANVGQAAVTLEPGGHHRMGTVISVGQI